MSIAKYFIIIITAFLSFSVITSACKPGANNNTTNTVQKSADKLQDDKSLNEYSKFLNKLDSTHMENSTVAATKYREIFKGKDLNTCDSAFFLFDNYYNRLSSNLHPLSDKSPAYSKKLKDNGFKVYMAEGDNYIGKDLDFVAKWFYEYVSPATKEYLTQLNNEDKTASITDGGLTIKAHKFVDRAIWWEKFIAKYPNSFVIAKAQSTWKNCMNTLLRGTENSPVIDYESNAISTYYKTAYSYLETSFPSTQTNKLVNPYYKHILKKENTKAENLLNDYQQKGIIY